MESLSGDTLKNDFSSISVLDFAEKEETLPPTIEYYLVANEPCTSGSNLVR
jgi:hypothetical protein